MHIVQNANEENAGSCPADPVLVMQAMGRKIGYIPAAARLADPDREMPLQIYLAEHKISLEQMADNVNDQLKKSGRCMVVISEGFDVGGVGEVRDSFGHVMFSSSQITVAQVVVNYLNKVGLAAKGAARGNVPGTDQRHSMAYASTVDLDEAYRIGENAAQLAATGQSGYMSTILRNPGADLQRPLRQSPAGRSRQQRAHVPEGLDRQQRLRRDRRFPPLRQTARRRRHGHAPHDRRPPTPRPPGTHSRETNAAQVRPPSRPKVGWVKSAQTHRRRIVSQILHMYELTPKNKFLVGIDSDGCAFDTMELKHKECFIPPFIKHYQLQGVSKYAREAAEFVNLYSKRPRLQPVSRADRAARPGSPPGPRSKPAAYNIQVPPGVVAWTKRETKLGNPALEAEVAKTGDADLAQALAWSKEVNAARRRHGPRRAAVSARPRVPAKAARPGRHPRRLGDAQRSPQPRMGGARHRPIRRRHLRAGNRLEKGSARQREKIRSRPHADDRRRARRPAGRRRQPAPGSSRSIPAPRKQAGNASSTKASTGSFRPLRPSYQKELLAEFDKRLPETPPWRTA